MLMLTMANYVAFISWRCALDKTKINQASFNYLLGLKITKMAIYFMCLIMKISLVIKLLTWYYCGNNYSDAMAIP
jgi:hypothetical protein